MMLKDLGNEKGSHVMCLNSRFDWYEVGLFAKPMYYCPYPRISMYGFRQSKYEIDGYAFQGGI